MREVQLPVSAFSRKILLQEYGGTDPLILTKGDLLYQALRVEPERIKSALNDLKQTLQCSVLLHLGNELSSQLVRNELAFSRIGVHIYKIHLDRLFTHINAQVRSGVEVKRAIQDFYDLYAITDDDLGLDTAYRYYHREELKKRRRKLLKFQEQSHPESKALTHPFQQRNRRALGDEIIRDFTTLYQEWGQRHNRRQRKNGRVSAKKIETFQILTLRHVNKLTFREIAEILHTSTSNVIQRNKHGMTIAQAHPELSKIYRRVLTTKGLECPFFMQ